MMINLREVWLQVRRFDDCFLRVIIETGVEKEKQDRQSTVVFTFLP